MRDAVSRLQLASLLLLAAMAAPLFAGPLSVDCVSCCPQEGADRSSVSAASCCGDDCGATLARGQLDSSTPIRRALAAVAVSARAPAVAAAEALPSPVALPSFCAASPPRVPAALRL